MKASDWINVKDRLPEIGEKDILDKHGLIMEQKDKLKLYKLWN